MYDGVNFRRDSHAEVRNCSLETFTMLLVIGIQIVSVASYNDLEGNTRKLNESCTDTALIFEVGLHGCTSI